MSEITKATIAFSAVGLLYIGLGIPLLLGRVRPNFWYGCRTRKTMSDERIWYAVNRITGRDLIGAGIFLMVSSVLVYIFGDHVNPEYAAIILLWVMLLSVTVMVINSIRAQDEA